MPKTKLARLCYNITKSKLPLLKVIKRKTKRKALTDLSFKEFKSRTGTYGKRKFSRKQLAAQRLFAKRARAGTLRKRRRR